jgi:hypothetical protein
MMEGLKPKGALIALGLLSWLAAPSPAACAETHQSRLRANPEGFSLTLQAPQHTFFIGERIPVTLLFSNVSRTPYEISVRSYDRSGRIHDLSFYVDGPDGGVCDPLASYFLDGWFGGGLGSSAELGWHAQTNDLNEWVRFDHAGSYGVYCTTTLVSSKNNEAKQVNLCSSTLSLTIIRPSERWTRAQGNSALQDLESESEERRQRGVRTLRFLGDSQFLASFIPLLDRPGLSSDAFFGLISAREPEKARQVLLKEMELPEVVVNHSYLSALAQLSLPHDRQAALPGEEAGGFSRERAQQVKATSATVLDQLAKVLPGKRGRARAVGCLVLLQQGKDEPGLRETMAGSFMDLTTPEQREILEYRWEQVRCPALEKVLEETLRRAQIQEDRRDSELVSLVLRRSQGLEQGHYRNLILEDMKRARPTLSTKILTSLPDRELPEMEQLLLSNLKGGGGDSEKTSLLIERYATARILPEVIRYYEKSEGRWACALQEALLGYWIKWDPTNGLQALARAAGFRKETGCFKSVLERVLSVHYSTEAEQLALPFLKDSHLDVADNVVSLFRGCGTAAAVAPLLDRLSQLNPELRDALPGCWTSESKLHADIVQCLLERKDWPMTEPQRDLLQEHLTTDAQRKSFARRFSESP